MSKLHDLPYASWLEESLKNLVKEDTRAIAIISKSASGDVGTGYWDCSVNDKILFGGLLQHDAVLDTMEANGYIDSSDEDEDDDEDFDDDMEEYDD